MVVEKLWTENSTVILVAVYVRTNVILKIGMAGDGCENVVDRKIDEYFCCGVCKGNFIYFNGWRGWFWKNCGQKTRRLFY